MAQEPEMKGWNAPPEPEPPGWVWVAAGVLGGALVAEWVSGPTWQSNLEVAAGFLLTIGVVTLMGKLYNSTPWE